jgi:hypothetical protein
MRSSPKNLARRVRGLEFGVAFEHLQPSADFVVCRDTIGLR